jgi:formylmethanofuran:tetrahydromethanopterin formyltransferase
MMMKARIVTAAAALLLMGSAASAQTTTTTTITKDQEAKVKTFVMKEKKPSMKITESVTVGAVLPSSVQFYELPADVGVTQYRYTVVNDKAVLVEPSSRKINDIIE